MTFVISSHHRLRSILSLAVSHYRNKACHRRVVRDHRRSYQPSSSIVIQAVLPKRCLLYYL
ncbi:unnamed protein product [Brassica oleracea]